MNEGVFNAQPLATAYLKPQKRYLQPQPHLVAHLASVRHPYEIPLPAFPHPHMPWQITASLQDDHP